MVNHWASLATGVAESTLPLQDWKSLSLTFMLCILYAALSLTTSEIRCLLCHSIPIVVCLLALYDLWKLSSLRSVCVILVFLLHPAKINLQLHFFHFPPSISAVVYCLLFISYFPVGISSSHWIISSNCSKSFATYKRYLSKALSWKQNKKLYSQVLFLNLERRQLHHSSCVCLFCKPIDMVSTFL
jgi:hypothetical protein